MKTLLVILLLFDTSFIAVHPMHVSVTEIEFDEKEHELEIMMRIFVDDLENAIREETNHQSLDLAKATEPEKRSIVGNYLEKHFTVSLDGKAQTLKYLGQEIEGEAMICYIQAPNVKKWKTIEVSNSILMNIFDDQSNLVHVTVVEKVKSMRLTTDNYKAKFSFE